MDYSCVEHINCEELNESIYGELLDRALTELDRNILYRSEQFHGEDHIIRTMANGAYIAKGERLTDAETWLLMLCCSYHDIGRNSEGQDYEHGPRAAEMIINGKVHAFDSMKDYEIMIAAAAISVHSQSDKQSLHFKNKYGITNDDLYMKMVKGLKDADNLDRVRLKDLDERFLRTETAKNGIAFAEKMLNIIPPKMEPYWL